MPMLNTHLRPDELVKCINGSQPKVLVFSRKPPEEGGISTILADDGYQVESIAFESLPGG